MQQANLILSELAPALTFRDLDYLHPYELDALVKLAKDKQEKKEKQQEEIEKDMRSSKQKMKRQQQKMKHMSVRKGS